MRHKNMKNAKDIVVQKLEIAAHISLISDKFPELLKTPSGVVFKFANTPENQAALDFHQTGGASNIKLFFERYKVLRNLTYTVRDMTSENGGTR